MAIQAVLLTFLILSCIAFAIPFLSSVILALNIILLIDGIIRIGLMLQDISLGDEQGAVKNTIPFLWIYSILSQNP